MEKPISIYNTDVIDACLNDEYNTSPVHHIEVSKVNDTSFSFTLCVEGERYKPTVITMDILKSIVTGVDLKSTIIVDGDGAIVDSYTPEPRPAYVSDYNTNYDTNCVLRRYIDRKTEGEENEN